MMTAAKLFCYILIIATTYQTVFTKDVKCIKCIKRFSKISNENRNHIKVEEEFNNIGLGLPLMPFISQLTHNGDNVFFQPQIVMGSTITGPLGYGEPHQDTVDYEYNFTSSNEILEADRSQALIVHKPEPAAASTTEKIIVPSLVIPEPPTYIPLNPPKFNSIHTQNIKVIEHQVTPIKSSPPCPEPSKPHVEVSKPVVIPEPPAYIPLNPPKLPLKIIPNTPKCPPTEIFKIPKCPPSIAEKYKIFVCPTLAIPQYKETIEVNHLKIQPHFPYFLPGAISTNGVIPSVVDFTNTVDPR